MTSSNYRSAATVVAIGYAASFLIRILTNLVLSRLLLPQDFGVMLVIVSITTLLGLMTDVGIGMAILRNNDSEDIDFRGTLWSLQLIQGVMLSLVLIGMAFSLQLVQAREMVSELGAFGTKSLPAILLLYAFGSAISGMRSMKLFFAQKNLLQNLLVRNELVIQLFSAMFTCALAWWLQSVWALAIAAVATQVLNILLSHFTLPGQSDKVRWNTAVLRREWPFAKWIWISSGLGVIAMQADKFLLSAVFTATTLGLFSLAAGLISAIEGGLSKVLNALGVPMLSSLAQGDHAKLISKYTSVASWTERITFFFVGIIAVAGEPIVRLLYPSNFYESGIYLSLLCVVITTGRVTLSTQFFLATGHSKYQALLSAGKLLFAFLFVLLGYYFYGAKGAVFGVSMQAFAMLIMSLVLEARLHVPFHIERGFSILIALSLGAISGKVSAMAIDALLLLFKA
jgi:O-antigen/teichoic acid export membrane protein